MHDNIAAWMIAGGSRTDEHDQRIGHLVAIREARRAARGERPSLVERLRARFGMPIATSAADCCAA